ncbi:zinc knuckle protein [Gregarina niphandrodes]|uniref:Zinc knuckle protein n=1 Tax=Gregarina niphandrodes TaxID=110365 RepID=A0A023AXG5_GRENI|nr:zinc knuckle protein [Gregarina niphandrodes]EZG42960.1 zinc knuckle protein [Gregarina niphandrodes]|eukprot:XP_011133768.1 zinc knuckle protein [Gregarina niphandrodes]
MTWLTNQLATAAGCAHAWAHPWTDALEKRVWQVLFLLAITHIAKGRLRNLWKWLKGGLRPLIVVGCIPLVISMWRASTHLETAIQQVSISMATLVATKVLENVGNRREHDKTRTASTSETDDLTQRVAKLERSQQATRHSSAREGPPTVSAYAAQNRRTEARPDRVRRAERNDERHQEHEPALEEEEFTPLDRWQDHSPLEPHTRRPPPPTVEDLTQTTPVTDNHTPMVAEPPRDAPPTGEPPLVRLTQCQQCGEWVGPNHRCWVSKKRFQCYKCGQPNHLAVMCKNQTGKVAVTVEDARDVTALCKEIERLSRRVEQIRSKSEANQAAQRSNTPRSTNPNEHPFGERPVLPNQE